MANDSVFYALFFRNFRRVSLVLSYNRLAFEGSKSGIKWYRDDFNIINQIFKKNISIIYFREKIVCIWHTVVIQS